MARAQLAVVLLLVPVALELLRHALGARFGEGRLFFLQFTVAPGDDPVVVLATAIGVATPNQDLEQRPHRASAAGAGKGAPGGEDRGAGG